jgi:hypothetical protein
VSSVKGLGEPPKQGPRIEIPLPRTHSFTQSLNQNQSEFNNLLGQAQQPVLSHSNKESGQEERDLRENIVSQVPNGFWRNTLNHH